MSAYVLVENAFRVYSNSLRTFQFVLNMILWAGSEPGNDTDFNNQAVFGRDPRDHRLMIYMWIDYL